MKVFMVVTRQQALDAAEKLRREAEMMSDDQDETEVRIVSVEIYNTVPENRLVPREYPCVVDKRLPTPVSERSRIE